MVFALSVGDMAMMDIQLTTSPAALLASVIVSDQYGLTVGFVLICAILLVPFRTGPALPVGMIWSRVFFLNSSKLFLVGIRHAATLLSGRFPSIRSAGNVIRGLLLSDKRSRNADGGFRPRFGSHEASTLADGFHFDGLLCPDFGTARRIINSVPIPVSTDRRAELLAVAAAKLAAFQTGDRV